MTSKQASPLFTTDSSGKYNAEQINNSVRQHWSVENNLHWSLDVIFKEDESLKKKGHSPKNYNYPKNGFGND
jgi:predicted transposase YbfD/YdcC